MSFPMTAGSKPGGSVTIFGRKVSYDALLVAGAGLLGVFFLYKVGQNPASNFGTGTVADTSGGAGDPSGIITTGGLPPTSAADPFSNTALQGAAQVLGYGGTVSTQPGPQSSGGNTPLETSALSSIHQAITSLRHPDGGLGGRTEAAAATIAKSWGRAPASYHPYQPPTPLQNRALASIHQAISGLRL